MFFQTDAERRSTEADLLLMEDVSRIFDQDLADKGVHTRFDRDRIDEVDFLTELAAYYPEPVPKGARKSIFDS